MRGLLGLNRERAAEEAAAGATGRAVTEDKDEVEDVPSTL